MSGENIENFIGICARMACLGKYIRILIMSKKNKKLIMNFKYLY